MGPNPLVSAIIPTYNRESVVTAAIDSILSQTYSNIEVIVVDDGSIDDTQTRLAQYGTRIRVITQTNAGPAAARNHGITVSSGQLVAFLDSDDIWLPNKVERQVKLLQAAGNSVPCCVCNITMQWAEKELASFEIASLTPSIEEGLWLNVPEVLATRFLLFNQGIMIRREVLRRIGGFDEKLWLLEDHELALRLSLVGPWAFIREPLVTWRESRTSLYQTARKEELRPAATLVGILEAHLANVKGQPELGRLARIVQHELISARRQLRVARMARSASWSAAIITKALRKVEQYRRSLYIRSRSFPRMQVEAVTAVRV